VKKKLLVPSQYSSLEGAVDAASPGDVVVVGKGIHYVTEPNGINLKGKSLSIRSEDPNDPDIVANTIIDCQATVDNPRRAFHFFSGEDPNTVIEGLTIRNGYMVSYVGRHAYVEPYDPNPDDDEAPNAVADGEDAPPYEYYYDPEFGIYREWAVDPNAYGGAILCENDSSPTIRNVVITDCIVAGGHGGDGADAPTDSKLAGGDGGDGFGNGYGGAIACRDGSSPRIINSVFQNCVAMGGSGGNGGDGDVKGPDAHGGNGGSAYGSGIGAAIYCDSESAPVISGTVFRNNVAKHGRPGSGGFSSDDQKSHDGAAGYIAERDEIAGGALFAGEGSRLTFTDCKFIANTAYQFDLAYLPTYVEAAEEIPYYRVGGALYAEPDSLIELKGCEFEENLGGGAYFAEECQATLTDCLFVNNYGLNEEDSQNHEKRTFDEGEYGRYFTEYYFERYFGEQEEEFDIDISDDDAEKLVTFQDVIDYIKANS